MIFYATKKTFDRYKLMSFEEIDDNDCIINKADILKEQGNRLHEWAVKVFYVDGRKSLAVMNFASKLTIFIVDLKVDEIIHFADIIVCFLNEIYKDDYDMKNVLLPKYLSETTFGAFAPLTDKSMISHINHIVSDFAWDGERFFDFIKDGIMNTKEINRQVNFDFLVSDIIDGKRDYIYPAERFKELLTEKYMN